METLRETPMMDSLNKLTSNGEQETRGATERDKMRALWGSPSTLRPCQTNGIPRPFVYVSTRPMMNPKEEHSRDGAGKRAFKTPPGRLGGRNWKWKLSPCMPLRYKQMDFHASTTRLPASLLEDKGSISRTYRSAQKSTEHMVQTDTGVRGDTGIVRGDI